MMTLEGCEDGHCEHPCVMLQEVEAQATGILRDAGVAAPPVPLDLLQSFDPGNPVEIRYIPLHAHYGAAWLVEDGWVLQLNSNQPPTVNRFVAFHEGYHILHRQPGSLRAAEGCDGCRSFAEDLADYFAASILMPRAWVAMYWERIHNVQAMAGLFQVPAGAMRSWLRRWGRG